MNTFKKLSGFSAALLLTASMGTAYAEEEDMTQLRTQDRDRTQINLQTPNSDFGQTQNREQQMDMNKNQNQYQNQYKQSNQTGKSDTGTNSMNRSVQDSAVNGSMNRQGTANRSMTGGKR